MTEHEAIAKFSEALHAFDEVRAGARHIGLQTVPGADVLRGAACLLTSGASDLVHGAQTDLATLDGEHADAAAQVMALLIQTTSHLVEAATAVAIARAREFAS